MKNAFHIFLQKKLKNNRFLGQIGLTIAFVLLMAFMLYEAYVPRFQYSVGEPWQEATLIAPFDFSLTKDPDTIEAQKQRAASEVFPIFSPDSASWRISRESLDRAFETLNTHVVQYRNATERRDSIALAKLDAEYFRKNFKLYGYELLTISRSGQTTPWLREARRLQDSILHVGYVAFSEGRPSLDVISLRQKSNLERVLATGAIFSPDNFSNKMARLRTSLGPMEKKLVHTLIQQSTQPNWTYDEALTEEEKNRVRGLVLPVYGKVAQGEVIIRKGDLVDSEVDLKIRSLEEELEKRVGKKSRASVFFSEALVILIITLLLMVYLSVNRTRIYCDNNKLALIFSTFLLTIGLMVLASQLTHVAQKVNDTFGPNLSLSYIYLAPACIVPIFITNFFDLRTGFLCNLMLALYGATLVQQSLEFAFVQIVAGTVAVYSQQRISKRKVFFYTLGYTLMAYVIAYLAFAFYSKSDFQSIPYPNLLLFGVNILLTVLAYNLIYPIERIFGVTSDLTYMELLDTNHPLLKKMARKAPGTFQHSLQVANIAEATINAIGGNALLVHVGALYHDIGKLQHPYYFIENKPSGKESPHENIDQRYSASIIIGHVDAGVELAQKHRLPREIINFIKTHHGTTRVEFFYRQFLKKTGKKEPFEEDTFRYKGPLPFSKETAVLMISDSVEAASRSLKKPTPKDISALVNSIIDYKINDGQLEHSNLTFKDITVIREVVVQQLLNIFHTRIEYPQSELDQAVSTTQISAS